MPAKPIGWTVSSLNGRELLAAASAFQDEPTRWVGIREAILGLTQRGERQEEAAHFEIEANAQETAKRVGGVAIGLYAVAEVMRAPAACENRVRIPLRLIDAANFGSTMRARKRAAQAVADGIVTKAQADELWARGYFEPHDGELRT